MYYGYSDSSYPMLLQTMIDVESERIYGQRNKKIALFFIICYYVHKCAWLVGLFHLQTHTVFYPRYVKISIMIRITTAYELPATQISHFEIVAQLQPSILIR